MQGRVRGLAARIRWESDEIWREGEERIGRSPALHCVPSNRYRHQADLPSVIHPLVLLSVVDHAARVPLSRNKRVLGVLLGQDNGNTINVANS